MLVCQSDNNRKECIVFTLTRLLLTLFFFSASAESLADQLRVDVCATTSSGARECRSYPAVKVCGDFLIPDRKQLYADTDTLPEFRKYLGVYSGSWGGRRCGGLSVNKVARNPSSPDEIRIWTLVFIKREDGRIGLQAPLVIENGKLGFQRQFSGIVGDNCHTYNFSLTDENGEVKGSGNCLAAGISSSNIELIKDQER